jgi:uncharacterized membrane protein
MSQPVARALRSPARFERIDALRGFAMLWMAVFHFDFDLNYLGFIQPRQRFFTDPFWVTQRTCILSLFLFCAGASLAVAMARGQGWERFFRRWWQIVAGAALVSLASWFVFPQRWIWFGVLHGMAVMLVAARVLAPLRAFLWGLVVVAIALPLVFRSDAFDAAAIQWLGLGLDKPATQDWVPLLPWLGVMLAGVAAGQWALANRPAWLSAPVGPWLQPLVTLGQWSLIFYLVHQPVFFGALMLVKRMTGMP